MSWLTVAWSMCAAACGMLALLNLFLWFKQRLNVEPLLLFLAALSAAAGAMIERMLQQATTIEAYGHLLQLENLSVYLLLVSLVWFVFLRFGTARRWLAMGITILWSVGLGISFTSPNSIVFDSIERLERHVTFWGEPFTIAVGATHPWKILTDVASILITLYVLDASVRGWRRGKGRRVVLTGSGIILFMLLGGIHAPLVDAGLVKTPYMISFAFLAIVLTMSYGLVSDAFLAPRYARQIQADAARWKSLLENVRLLVLQLDRSGGIVYANPYSLEVSGYAREEMRGLSFTSLLHEKDREEFSRRFAAAMDGGTQDQVEAALVTHEGMERQVVWASVLIRDPQGEVQGLLGIGSDVTERRSAEGARDHALQELQALKQRLDEENLYLREELTQELGFTSIIGDSRVMRYVKHRIQQVAQTETNVLILGETGVGKELVARAIHEASPRRDRPYIRVNCAALPLSLVDSELFGHEKGAFTGAERTRQGRFELADRGTLFLDEMGELAVETQAKLLRVLEDGTFERVGGSETRKVDARLIAATNRDLEAEVRRGRFRADLFYRVNVYPLTVPPLRQRQEDIPALVEHFVARNAAVLGKKIEQVPGSVMFELTSYDWPGNVRELENVIERAVIISADGVLRLPQPLGRPAAEGADGGSKMEARASLEEMEREYIREVLQSTGWRISGEKGAADILGINPSTLRSRMKKLGILPPR